MSKPKYPYWIKPEIHWWALGITTVPGVLILIYMYFTGQLW
jgi:hypothetical protein